MIMAEIATNTNIRSLFSSVFIVFNMYLSCFYDRFF